MYRKTILNFTTLTFLLNDPEKKSVHIAILHFSERNRDTWYFDRIRIPTFSKENGY